MQHPLGRQTIHFVILKRKQKVGPQLILPFSFKVDRIFLGASKMNSLQSFLGGESPKFPFRYHAAAMFSNKLNKMFAWE